MSTLTPNRGLVKPVTGDPVTIYRTAIGTNADILDTVRGAFYGDGSDGVATADGATAVAGMTRSGSVYTLTRDVYFSTFTINSGVTVITAGYRLHVKGTLTNNGTIHNDGSAGVIGGATGPTSGGNGAPAGVLGGGLAGASSTVVNTNGNAAGAQTDPAWGGAGGSGGTGPSSRTGGAGGTIPAPLGGKRRAAPELISGFGVTAAGALARVNAGAGGGAGGGLASVYGGAGGGGGGWCVVCAAILVNNGTIRAAGGAGGDGGASWGPGGGGGGGVVVAVYGIKSGAGTITAPGGASGAIGGASAGFAGSAGLAVELLS